MQDSLKATLEAVTGENSPYEMSKSIADLQKKLKAEQQRASKSAEMLDCWKEAVANVDSKLCHAISVLMDGEPVAPERKDIMAIYNAGRGGRCQQNTR